MAKRVYAQDTKVPVAQSEREIRKMLKEIGSTTYAMVEDGNRVAVRFQVGTSVFQIERPGLPDIPHATPEQKERAAWRAIVLLVKAKKTAILQGISTVEREFMADTLLPDGTKLINHYNTIREASYRDGPPLIGLNNEN